jgi:branched-chain amino acid transport system permease protein
MFFAAGLYGAGLGSELLGLSMPVAFLAGVAAGLALALAVGLVALRTSGVAFMIVTLMFAQAFYLALLHFNAVTHGDEGFVMAEAARRWTFAGVRLDAAAPTFRYNAALVLFALGYGVHLALARAPVGRVLIGVRENEDRVRMLGYDTFRYRLFALAVSGALAGAAGAAYALLFAYVGATFAATQYSIYPLLWVLLGGAGTALGPLLGTAIMFHLVDRLSGVTSSYLILVGLALIVLVVLFPKGIIGTVRERLARRRP